MPGNAPWSDKNWFTKLLDGGNETGGPTSPRLCVPFALRTVETSSGWT